MPARTRRPLDDLAGRPLRLAIVELYPCERSVNRWNAMGMRRQYQSAQSAWVTWGRPAARGAYPFAPSKKGRSTLSIKLRHNHEFSTLAILVRSNRPSCLRVAEAPHFLTEVGKSRFRGYTGANWIGPPQRRDHCRLIFLPIKKLPLHCG